MFSSSGCFSSINCPLQHECTLLNCIFRHELVTNNDDVTSVHEPEPKRRRLSPEASLRRPTSRYEESAQVFTGAINTAPLPLEDEELRDTKVEYSIGTLPKEGNNSEARSTTPAQKPISPPPIKRLERPVVDRDAKKAVKISSKPLETLNPRMVTKAPANHQTRHLYLKKLHEGMVRLNEEAKKSTDASIKALTLTDGELITLALDEEEKIAKENGPVYGNIIKLRMVSYSRKMTLAEWKVERLKASEITNGQKTGLQSSVTNDSNTPLLTGLTQAEELRVLPQLIANQSGLDRYGYVTTPPIALQVDKASEAVAKADGWENCDRCKARFQVYPERREDGALTTGGRCRYHHGRIVYPERNSSGGYTNSKERTYNCCNETVGSSVGCVYADTHVFKVEDPSRLATVLQFERTPANTEVEPDSAICYDCEMGYTVYGLELIRLTAVSWPNGEDLLDVLVRPYGAVLDLNSRHSGIYPKDFLAAKPYQETKDSVKSSKELRIVESPQVARELLFKLLSPHTPLIGHAIENDLNTTRIVHPAIIDTVLLFPHPSGLPRRRALKALAKQVLNRDIQTGHGSAGHDSREDALATGDLVRWQVSRKWREMQRDGWKFVNGALVQPTSKAP